MRASEILFALSLAGCSLTASHADPCESTAECRAAFGLGSACGDDGFCQPVGVHPRCERAFPANLLSEGPLYRGAFVIGAIADESVETHRARQNAVQLALSEARDQGGIDGQLVGVVFCTNEVDPSIDDLDQRGATEAVTRYLVEELAVTAIVGPPSSDATSAAFAIAAPLDALVISPSATSPALTALEPAATDAMPGLLWRTVPPDSLQGRVIAGDLDMRGVSRVALILQDSSYGNGLADVIEEYYGGAVERFPFSTPSGRNSAATSAGSGDFEEVVFISSQTSDASAFLLFAESFAGFADKQLFLTDSAKNLDLLTDARAAAAVFPRVRGSAPAPLAGVAYDAFLASYRAEFGEDARSFSFAANAHDAAWLTLLGASWAGLQEPDLGGRSLARGLRHLSGGVPVTLGADVLTTARDRFRLGEAIDIEGVSGALDYDPVLEETSAPVEIWTIDAGATGFVSEYEVTP
ncbi:MAG: ABC transporter substrate-binding protein [Sandaracinaceae bacterium]|nr:ABC transporter substrate-binding protein [Sandaracinaceae bacterium]